MKLLLVSVLVALGIFYGIDVSTKGIHQVYGPVVPTTSHEALALDHNKAIQKQKELDNQEAVRQFTNSGRRSEPFSSRLATKTGELLQITAHHSIKLVVSIFDALFN